MQRDGGRSKKADEWSGYVERFLDASTDVVPGRIRSTRSRWGSSSERIYSKSSRRLVTIGLKPASDSVLRMYHQIVLVSVERDGTGPFRLSC